MRLEFLFPSYYILQLSGCWTISSNIYDITFYKLHKYVVCQYVYIICYCGGTVEYYVCAWVHVCPGQRQPLEISSLAQWVLGLTQVLSVGGSSFLSGSCFCFSLCCSKYLTEGNLERKGLFWLMVWEGRSSLWGNDCSGSLLWPVTPHPHSGDQETKLHTQRLPLSNAAQNPRPWDGAAHLKWGWVTSS